VATWSCCAGEWVMPRSSALQMWAVPGWDNLHTDFLDRLDATGVEPHGIDHVLNTHLHFDHVGWHTHMVDGVWQAHISRRSVRDKDASGGRVRRSA
jgi:glyoxylase-like metal-dependent hydrolase (beta-lactamase superfamily II)